MSNRDYKTTISQALHKLGLYMRVVTRKPLLKLFGVCHKEGRDTANVEEGTLVR